MKKRMWVILVAAAVFAVAAGYCYCERRLRTVPRPIWSCLKHPRQMVLLSLDPEGPFSNIDDTQHFHGYRILGKLPIELPAEQTRIAREIRNGVLWFSEVRGCFNPRHGLRLNDGRKTYDLVLCFECKAMRFYTDGVTSGSTSLGGEPKVLTQLLESAGIPIATPPTE